MLADWLAAGADPGKMTSEEVRRQQNLLVVREEQAASRLEKLIEDREALFRRGATTRSTALRRVLARRHGRVDADVRAAERELARIAKEVAGFAAVRLCFKRSFSCLSVAFSLAKSSLALVASSTRLPIWPSCF